MTTLIAGLALAQGSNPPPAPKRVAPSKPAKQEQAPPAKPTPEQNWKDASTPGPHQKILENYVGHWKSHATMQVDPARPAEESDGTADGTLLLGGRFIQMVHKGTAMGQPFEGLMLMGYDNIAKKYVSVWMDNMGTSITHYDGTYDKNLKKLMTGARFIDPMSRQPTKVRAVTTFVDPTSWTYEEFTAGPDGKDRLTLKITFKKA